MPRNGQEVHRRLQQAALELFSERGYHRTTTAEIAKRAEVSERTFYRHFADKCEVLFDAADDFRAFLADRISRLTDVSEPLLVITQVLTEFDWEGVGSRNLQRQRHAIISANPELLECELIKIRCIAVGLSDALQHLGVEARTAQLAARLGVEVFIFSYEQWLSSDDGPNLAITTQRFIVMSSELISGNRISSETD